MKLGLIDEYRIVVHPVISAPLPSQSVVGSYGQMLKPHVATIEPLASTIDCGPVLVRLRVEDATAALLEVVEDPRHQA